MNKVKIEEVIEFNLAYFIVTIENNNSSKVFLYKDGAKFAAANRTRESELAQAMEWAKQMEQFGHTRTLIYETKIN